jgi:pyruvate/2-oxoglutarate/acetoin dehydrogenase E1 component
MSLPTGNTVRTAPRLQYGLSTPIIESGAIGAALGLALGGYVPMVEMQ